MKKTQCKDIRETPILEFLQIHGGIGCHRHYDYESERNIGNAFPQGLPHKLMDAKLKQMIKKGLIEGCMCGCRGDFRLTDKGLKILNTLTKEDVIHAIGWEGFENGFIVDCAFGFTVSNIDAFSKFVADNCTNSSDIKEIKEAANKSREFDEGRL